MPSVRPARGLLAFTTTPEPSCLAHGTPGVTGGDLGLNSLAAGTFDLQSGSSLRVSVGQDAATAIHSDASKFAGTASSPLRVSAGGSTGTDVFLADGAVFNHTGTIAASRHRNGGAKSSAQV